MCIMRYLFILILFSNFILVKSQEFTFDLQAIYNLSYQSDSLNPKSVKFLEMELLISNDRSIFQTLKRRRSDSLLAYQNTNHNTFTKGGLVLRLPSKFSYVVHKDNINISVFDSPFGIGTSGKEIIYNYIEKPIVNWRIKNDTIHLANHVCQKAETFYGGRLWIAWFALDIPISDGPYKFSGLPGLIMQIYDSKKYWNFTLVNLNRNKITHKLNFQKWYIYQNKSKEELYNDRRVYQTNLITSLESQGIDVNDTEYLKIKNTWNDLLKSDNNWIELYP